MRRELSREFTRFDRKTRKTRLGVLEKLRRKDGRVDRVVTQLEENFPGDRLETAKVFFGDYFLAAQFALVPGGEGLTRLCQDYGLKPAERDFIIGLLNDVLTGGPVDR